MINVQIDEADALEMLVARVSFWTDDRDIIRLFRNMYSGYLDNGVFNGVNFDVKAIVDNDYTNWCEVIDETDPNFRTIMQAARNDEYDLSCEDVGYSTIEAYDGDKGLILVRY